MTTVQMLLGLRVAALAGAGAIGGCASDCGADWYGLGARDGRLGAQPQAERYAARCNATADTQRYMAGWQAGSDERPIPLW